MQRTGGEMEKPGWTIGFTKHWVPAAQLQDKDAKHNTAGEKHISIPLTNHRVSGGTEKTREETFGISCVCSSRIPQEIASIEGNSMPNEVIFDHVLERHIPQVAGQQWTSKRRPDPKGRIGLSISICETPWGVEGAGQVRQDLRQWSPQTTPDTPPVCAALRPRRGAQWCPHLSVQSATVSVPPGTWWAVRAAWLGQG